MRYRVKNNQAFVKDFETQAVLNTDTNALIKHETKMAHLNRIKHQEEEINSIKSDVSELKQMLQELLKRI